MKNRPSIDPGTSDLAVSPDQITGGRRVGGSGRSRGRVSPTRVEAGEVPQLDDDRRRSGLDSQREIEAIVEDHSTVGPREAGGLDFRKTLDLAIEREDAPGQV